MVIHQRQMGSLTKDKWREKRHYVIMDVNKMQ